MPKKKTIWVLLLVSLAGCSLVLIAFWLASVFSPAPPARPTTCPASVSKPTTGINDPLLESQEQIDLARAVLQIAGNHDAGIDTEHWLQHIQRIADNLKPLLSKAKTPREKLKILSQYLHQQSYTPIADPDAVAGQLHTLLRTRNGNCLSFSLLYAILGERLELPLYVIPVPGHIFIRYDDGTTQFNVEAAFHGKQFAVGHYLRADRKSGTQPSWGFSKFYFRKLSKREVIGLVIYNQGIVLERQGKPAHAMVCTERATAINPDHAESWCSKAMILLSMKKFGEALNCCNKALDLYPYLSEARLIKLMCLVKMGKNDEAIACLNKTTELALLSEKGWGYAGALYMGQGKYERATECFAKAILLNPRNVPAWILKGRSHSCNLQYKEAVECLDKAISLQPDNEEAWFYRGMSEIGTRADLCPEKVNKAIECFNEMIRINPKNWLPWLKKGIVFANMRKHKEAAYCYGKALDVAPVPLPADLVRLYTLRGGQYGEIGDYSKALKDINTAIQRNPSKEDLEEAYVARALVHVKMDRHDKAIDDCNTALQLSPDSSYCYSIRGMARDDKGEYDKAIQDYDKAIKLNPKWGWLYSQRAVVYFHKRMYDKAWADVIKSKALGSTPDREFERQLEEARLKMRR